MTSPIQLWGGVECTINRVGNRFIDQLERCGHYRRLAGDLDLIASLGIRTLRYPALWERNVPLGQGRTERFDWRVSDVALGAMRDRQIEPIIGLVHHGSGPPWTNLLDPGFPAALAHYAAAFARRYPWVRFYTPINEPLTTARFSALYGHWYPHARDDQSFVTALLGQCRAIVLAMEAIRAVNPAAELVQTEDAGSSRGTPALATQTAFENDRRWLSLDLIAGRVTPVHPLWGYLHAPAAPSDLNWFEEHRVSPSIIGLNYYATSDRFLDERVHLYPAASHGGNGRVRYADVAAARVRGVGIRGHARVLDEAWRRYGLPVAITEAHLGCSREEQMRWLADAWEGAHAARKDGADVRAVTAWALLGSWDWDCLVTRSRGHYEPGAFDVRGARPRPTALAPMIQALAGQATYAHPVLSRAGWWRPASGSVTEGSCASQTPAPVLIVGGSGTLGRAVAAECDRRRIPFVALSRHALDVTDPILVQQAVAHHRPWAIVNTAGYVRVDDAEGDTRMCRRVNAVAAAILAAVCRKAAIRLLTFSSDLVFDGATTQPYVETDVVAPVNVYGHTKAEAERRVQALAPSALVVRTSAFFGPSDQSNFVSTVLHEIKCGRTVRVAGDVTVSPTYVPDLVDASLDLLIDGASGLWHLANEGAVTWAEFAAQAAHVAGLNPERIEACPVESLPFLAARPRYSVLGSMHGSRLPTLDDSLARYVHACRRLGTAA